MLRLINKYSVSDKVVGAQNLDEVLGPYRERVPIELMTSDRKLQASREGSK